MGRKKKGNEAPAPPPPPPRKQEEREDSDDDRSRRDRDSDDDSSDYEVRRRTHDIHQDIQELACAFGIDQELTQKLNDIMIEERKRTWQQDLDRLYELLKEARTPPAVLRLKLKDMEKGKFVGKAKCGPKVRELARKHRLDRGASTKLEEAMSMREAMGKDIDKDLGLLDEHLAASNAPSKLISMKLESLRKGFNLGHCIYSRETIPGNQGPGVDGVFDERKRRPLGYTDADLDRRFAESSGGGRGGELMDEATVLKMMAAERKKVQARDDPDEEPDRGRGKKKGRGRSPSRSKRRGSKSKSKGRRRKGDSRSRSSRSRSRSKVKRKQRSSSSSRKPSRSRGKSAPSKGTTSKANGNSKKKRAASSSSDSGARGRQRVASNSSSPRRKSSGSSRGRDRSKRR